MVTHSVRSCGLSGCVFPVLGAGDVEVRDLGTRGGVADLGVSTEISDEHHFVEGSGQGKLFYGVP